MCCAVSGDLTHSSVHFLLLHLPQVAVPSVLELWLPQLRLHRSSLKLRQLVSSGEGLTAALAAQLLDAVPDGCVLVNLYGEPAVVLGL